MRNIDSFVSGVGMAEMVIPRNSEELESELESHFLEYLQAWQK